MSIVRKNIIANMVGKGLCAILAIAFVPFYIRLLGTEAYGLIGFSVSLMGLFALADFGMSAAFMREIARLSASKDGPQQAIDLCRTFEIIFGVIGVLAASIIISFSTFLAAHWVNREALSVNTINKSILLMGIVVGLQLPFFVYQAALLGLQRQVSFNTLLVGMGLLRGLGTVLILRYLSASIQSYFEWQVFVSLCQLVIGHFLVWRHLRIDQTRPKLDIALVRSVWRFAAGMAAITVSSVILSQSDKLILSKMVRLEDLGYYSLAGVVATVPLLLGQSFNNAVYPRLTQLVAQGNKEALTGLYHRACQFQTVLLAPVGLVLVFFSKEVMAIWTRSAAIAQNTSLLVSVLVIGSTLLSFMVVPFALQLAYAWTTLSLGVNLVAILVLIPLIILLVSAYGALGAALVWVVLNVGYVIGTIQLMHRRILPGEKSRWYRDDVGKPLLAALATVIPGRLLITSTLAEPELVLCLGILSVVSACAAALCAPLVRNAVLRHATFRLALGRVK